MTRGSFIWAGTGKIYMRVWIKYRLHFTWLAIPFKCPWIINRIKRRMSYVYLMPKIHLFQSTCLHCLNIYKQSNKVNLWNSRKCGKMSLKVFKFRAKQCPMLSSNMARLLLVVSHSFILDFRSCYTYMYKKDFALMHRTFSNAVISNLWRYCKWAANSKAQTLTFLI